MNAPSACLSLVFSGFLLAGPPPRLARSESTGVTEAIPDDPAVAKVIAPLAAEIKASFGRPLVSCPTGLVKGRSDANPLGFWVADVMRAAAQAGIGKPVAAAFTNNGGLRKNIAAGTVTVGAIFELMPFENALVVAEYTGAEVAQLVKETIQRRGGDPMSGIRAVLAGTPDKPELTVTWADGTAIDPAATYRLATTDYLLASGDSIPTIKKGRNPLPTGLALREVLLAECERLGKAGKGLEVPTAGRFQFSAPMLEALQARTIVW